MHEISRRRTLRRPVVAGALVMMVIGSVLTLGSTVAGADGACGTFSYGFTGTRLLNDGISDSAGPFTISLPAGTYDVTLRSNDWAHAQDDQITQPEEQWYVALDSGYRSPLSSDIPDHLTDGEDRFPGQVIAASTAISVHHRGVGGINSVNPMCVGFTPVDSPTVAPEPEPETELPPPASIVRPEPVTDPDTETPDVANPNKPDGPDTETPDVTNPNKPDTDPPDITDPDKPDSSVTPDDDPEVEVEGAVEERAEPELALTGPADRFAKLGFVGIGLMALGFAVVWNERRGQRLI